MMFTILRMEYITNFQFSTKSFMHFVSTKHIHIIQTVRNKASGNSQSIAMVQQKRQQKMHTEFERWMMLILPSFSHCVASSLSLSRFLQSVFLIRWQCNTRAKISFLNEQRRNVTYFVYSWTMNMLKITKCMSICDFWMRSPPTNCCHWKWTSKTEGERDRRRDTFSMAIRNYIRCAVKPTHQIE